MTRQGTARARATLAQEEGSRREEGVTEMVRMMAEGEWHSGSALGIAREYGVLPSTAAAWAGEASRQLRALERLDAEALRSSLVARLEKHERAAGDGSREAIAAVAKIADIEGLGADARAKADEQIAAFLTAYFRALHEVLAPDQYRAALEAVDVAKQSVRRLRA